jgi:hypothetical protein
MSNSKEYPTITVGQLIDALSIYPPHYTLDFSGLDFYRVKQRGDTHIQIEFNQAVYRTDKGRVAVENLD